VTLTTRGEQARIVDLELHSGRSMNPSPAHGAGATGPLSAVPQDRSLWGDRNADRVPPDLNIDPTDNFLRDVEDVLGPGAASVR
jgi:hypothetical protein